MAAMVGAGVGQVGGVGLCATLPFRGPCGSLGKHLDARVTEFDSNPRSAANPCTLGWVTETWHLRFSICTMRMVIVFPFWGFLSGG